MLQRALLKSLRQRLLRLSASFVAKKSIQERIAQLVILSVTDVKKKATLRKFAVQTATPIKLFEHLKENCTPIATKERRHSSHDNKFISAEVRRLLSEDLIAQSNSPWRAQPFVITPENHLKRLVIDYSQTRGAEIQGGGWGDISPQ